MGGAVFVSVFLFLFLFRVNGMGLVASCVCWHLRIFMMTACMYYDCWVGHRYILFDCTETRRLLMVILFAAHARMTFWTHGVCVGGGRFFVCRRSLYTKNSYCELPPRPPVPLMADCPCSIQLGVGAVHVVCPRSLRISRLVCCPRVTLSNRVHDLGVGCQCRP